MVELSRVLSVVAEEFPTSSEIRKLLKEAADWSRALEMGRVSRFMSQIASLQATVVTKDKRIENQTATICELQNQVQKLDPAKYVASERLLSAGMEISSLQQKCEDLRDTLAFRDDCLKNNANALHLLEQKIEKLEEEKALWEKKVVSRNMFLEIEVKNLRNNILAFTTERDNALKERDVAEKRFEEIEAAHNYLSKRIEQQARLILKEQSDKVELQNRLAIKASALKDVRDQLRELKTQLEALDESAPKCPDCGQPLVYAGRSVYSCINCPSLSAKDTGAK